MSSVRVELHELEKRVYETMVDTARKINERSCKIPRAVDLHREKVIEIYPVGAFGDRVDFDVALLFLHLARPWIG